MWFGMGYADIDTENNEPVNIDISLSQNYLLKYIPIS
jgi:hypothetical protein